MSAQYINGAQVTVRQKNRTRHRWSFGGYSAWFIINLTPFTNVPWLGNSTKYSLSILANQIPLGAQLLARPDRLHSCPYFRHIRLVRLPLPEFPGWINRVFVAIGLGVPICSSVVFLKGHTSIAMPFIAYDRSRRSTFSPPGDLFTHPFSSINSTR